MSVTRPDAEHLVATGIVAVVSATMAAGKTEEGHRGHAGGSKDHAEDVEIHLTLDVARVASPAQSRGELSPWIGVQQGAMARTAFVRPLHFQVPSCDHTVIPALSCSACWQRPVYRAAVVPADRALPWSPP